MKPNKILSFIAALSISGMTHGYEVETHKLISVHAVQASTLANGLKSFDIDGLDAMLPDGTIAGTKFSGKVIYCYEGSSGKKRSIVELIQMGAFCEDSSLGSKGIARYLNHFYNPINHTGFPGGGDSLTWANGDGLPMPTQEFGISDITKNLYKAATLPEKEERERSLARAIRTTGHIIHLIQDLAQPQHTRSDGHGDGSLYERYTDLTRSTLPFSGYTAPEIQNTKFSELWDATDLRGLADYSNMNFVSAGTNFDKQSFQFPKFDPNRRIQVRIEDLCRGRTPACPNPYLTGMMTFFGNDVVDHYTNETVRNPYASTYSIFSDDLEKQSDTPKFVLNRFNFELAQTFLIPRAVAYSTAFINFMFEKGEILNTDVRGQRGRMDMLSAPGFYKSIELFYDDSSDVRHPVPMTYNGGFYEFTPISRTKMKVPDEYILVRHTRPGTENGNPYLSEYGIERILVKKIMHDTTKIYGVAGPYVDPYDPYVASLSTAIEIAKDNAQKSFDYNATLASNNPRDKLIDIFYQSIPPESNYHLCKLGYAAAHIQSWNPNGTWETRIAHQANVFKYTYSPDECK